MSKAMVRRVSIKNSDTPSSKSIFGVSQQGAAHGQHLLLPSDSLPAFVSFLS